MRKNRIEYLALLIVLTLVFIFSDNYYSLMFLAATVSAPVLSYIFLVSTYRQVSLTILEPSGMMDSREIIYVLGNTSAVPAVCVLWDVDLENCLSKNTVHQRLMGSVKGKGCEKIRLKIENTRTGKVNINTTQVRVYDFLGLFSRKITAPDPIGVITYPKALSVQLSNSQFEVSGDGAQYSHNRAGSDVNEVFSFHEYADGDETKNIHWKLSAKTDTLIVRDFGHTLNRPVTLLLELITDAPVRNEETLGVCFDAFVSISSALLSRGVFHSAAWFDHEKGAFRLEEIGDMQGLEMYLPEILGTCAYRDQPNALKYYKEYLAPGASVLLYYVTPTIVTEVLEFSLDHKVKTIHVAQACEPEIEDDEAQQMEIVTVYQAGGVAAELII